MISMWKTGALLAAFSATLLGCSVESTTDQTSDDEASDSAENAIVKTCGLYGPSCSTGYTCNITSNVGINPQGVCVKKCSFYGTKCRYGQVCQYDGNGGINPQGICVDAPKTCSFYGAKCPSSMVCQFDGNGGINPSGVCVARIDCTKLTEKACAANSKSCKVETLYRSCPPPPEPVPENYCAPIVSCVAR